MYKKILVSLLTSSMFLAPIHVHAEETPTIKEYTFYSSTPAAEYDSVEETMAIGSSKYKLDHVEYTMVSENSAEISKEYTDLNSQTVDKEITENGVTYTLKDVQFKESENENSKKTVTHDESLGFFTYQPSASDTLEFDTEVNGKTKKVTGTLKEVKASSPYFASGYTFTGYYYGDDPNVAYYRFNGVLIPNNGSSVPYAGYENLILSDLGLNTSIARIDSASWSGNTIIDGQNVRTALFNYSLLGSSYTATYEAEVGESTLYNASATYSLKDVEDTYEMKAIAYYKKDTSIFKVFVGGILVLALIIVGIFYFLKKKRNKNEEEVATE